MGPHEVPGGSWIVQGVDPQGANFALVSPDPLSEREMKHGSKITPCLWYDHDDAEEAANFYVTPVPRQPDRQCPALARRQSVDEGRRTCWSSSSPSPASNISASTAAPSSRSPRRSRFQVRTEDQAETDRLWDALIANGGEESQCGWLKDRWGLSWQITPKRLLELIGDPDQDRARRAMEAMMTMRKIDIAAIERGRRRRNGDADGFRRTFDVRPVDGLLGSGGAGP